NLTGLHESCCADEEPHLQFRYRMIRLWQVPKERLLRGGLAMLALAPLGAVRPDELPRVIDRMADQLRQRTDRALRGKLWTAIYVAMGLRYEQALVNQLLQGVHEMEESVTYQAIIEKGFAKGLAEGREKGLEKGLKSALLIIGRRHFGEPDQKVQAALDQLH